MHFEKHIPLNDTPELWREDPLAAFNAFVRSETFLELGKRSPAAKKNTGPDEPKQSMPIRDTSVKGYSYMFGKFHRWIRDKGLILENVKHQDILSFLDQTIELPPEPDSLSKVVIPERRSEIRQRYLRLLEKIYIRIGAPENPAKKAAIKTYENLEDLGRNAPTEFLTPEEAKYFFEHLPKSGDWKTIRDAAINAVLLGAGLKPSEVIGLVVSNVLPRSARGFVPIKVSPASVAGTSKWHNAQLTELAQPYLARWLEMRETLGFKTDILFPSTMKGGMLNKVTIYRSTKAYLSSLKIDVNRLGGRTLRNTYAILALLDGIPPVELANMLGLFEPKSVNLYIMALNRSDLAKTSKLELIE